ncbi:helicase-related protein, partial [Escherichia coli]|uniref:helicase-related protein n=1 Tax=Escherichia coli TaxID=562 RepID=UPI0021F3C44E
MTFAVDVESATEIALAFRKRHVNAEVVSAKTPPGLRRNIMERFEAGDVLQLVSVDLYGEGVDVPACEGISMARPTNS